MGVAPKKKVSLAVCHTSLPPVQAACGYIVCCSQPRGRDKCAHDIVHLTLPVCYSNLLARFSQIHSCFCHSALLTLIFLLSLLPYASHLHLPLPWSDFCSYVTSLSCVSLILLPFPTFITTIITRWIQHIVGLAFTSCFIFYTNSKVVNM